MKRFRAITVIALLALLSGCLSAPAPALVGSLDRNVVELLQNGKARYVDIYSINDFHATLAEDVTPIEGKNPGMAKLAQSIMAIRAANPNSAFVSAGDNYQGSALSILSSGRIVSEFFRLVGMSASAVGNHEFDWGDGHFADWSAEGGFPFLAANLVDKTTGELPTWAREYAIVNVGGHRIAFIGLMTIDTLTTVRLDNIENYEILDAADVARELVAQLRYTEKPEAVIVLSHIPAVTDRLNPARVISSSASNEIERLSLVRGIDAIITGHSHSSVNGRINGVPVVQAYYNGRSLAKLAFAFNEDNSFRLTTSLVALYTNKATITANAEAQSIYDRYMAEYAPTLLQKVAMVDGELWHENLRNVTPMGLWVCEALRERFGTQVAVMNGGGLRKGFAPGQVTVMDFWDLMPFDNTAVTFRVSGAVLKAIIENGIDSAGFVNGQFSGLVVNYNPGRPYGNKILSMTLADGTPVTADGIYSVVTNDFVFLNGGDGYTMMPNQDPAAFVETFIPIRDVLIETARAQGTIVAPAVHVLVSGTN
ncbi:MAG: hypothetical protein A2087_12865 [Spirochaetes bacterium GWD1_61_31]|nr:MAG: hypothetical protein A2Y37_02235 [Spirochaetes bacterium GWB1_60_80]OHD35648.1 MAG: hypothetical protein A2087_12865 [Spirochaetes bacterium GWD1_61_31]OHD41746.1 MAG: hypothetical protein A2Y35_09105 [Spirochaetes bacterium GWE1_60_18]